MLNQLKAFLSDAQLRQKLQKAASLEETITLMKTADIGQEYQVFVKRSHISNNSLTKALQSQFNSMKLGEAELLHIAGGIHGFESHTQGACNTHSC